MGGGGGGAGWAIAPWAQAAEAAKPISQSLLMIRPLCASAFRPGGSRGSLRHF